MSKVNVIGGLLGLFGGAAMLAEIFLRLDPGQLGWILNLSMAGIVILGGILGLAGKKSGGGILLIMAILLILFGALSFLTPSFDMMPYSVFGRFNIGSQVDNLIVGIPLEAFIILLGGILVLASSSE